MLTRFITKILQPCVVYYQIKVLFVVVIKLSLGNGEKAILGDFFCCCIRLEMNSDHEEEEEHIFILQFVRTNKKHGPFRNPFSRETEGQGERLLLSFLGTSDTLPSLRLPWPVPSHSL